MRTNKDMEKGKTQIYTGDYWEIERTAWESTGNGTEMREYAYLINRFRGEVKKVTITSNENQ